MPADSVSERYRGLVAVTIVTIAWSLNFVCARPAAQALDPVVLTWIRAVAATAVFVPALLFSGERRALTLRGVWRSVPAAITCIGVNQVCFLMASSRTSPTHVALVVATIPVFVAIIARLYLGEHLARRRVLGIAVAFAGVVWLATERGAGGSAVPTGTGDLIAIAAAVSFAAYTVINKKLVTELGAFPATVLTYIAGTILLAPLALLGVARGGLSGLSDGVVALSASYLIVFATLVAYPLFSYALARLTASRVAVFTYLQPVGAALASYSLGWERFTLGTVLAAGVVIAGVALAQRRVGEPSGVTTPTRYPDL